MEFEQIGKRLEWLDEQQRKNKTDLINLGERLTSIETSVNALTQQFKTLSQGLAEIAPSTARINQFDQMMTKQRTDLSKMIETTEKNAIRREQESSKLHHTELEALRKTIVQLGRTIDPEDIYKKIQDHTRENQRLNLAVQDVRTSVDGVAGQSKEMVLAQKAIEESRRQDAKRLADLQGEIASVRKRADDANARKRAVNRFACQTGVDPGRTTPHQPPATIPRRHLGLEPCDNLAIAFPNAMLKVATGLARTNP